MKVNETLIQMLALVIIAWNVQVAWAGDSIFKNRSEWLYCASQGLGADTGSDRIEMSISQTEGQDSLQMKVVYPDFPGGRVYQYSGRGIATDSKIDLLFSPGAWSVAGEKTNSGCGIVGPTCYRIRFGHSDQKLYDELICYIRKN